MPEARTRDLKGKERKNYSFADLLYWHVEWNGTRPDGVRREWGRIKGKAISEFAEIVGVSDRAPRTWFFDDVVPERSVFVRIMDVLFGAGSQNREARVELESRWKEAQDRKKPIAEASGVLIEGSCPYTPLGSQFKGRREIVDLINDSLSAQIENKLTKPARLAIYGLPGIGKTRAAIEFAYKFRNDYSAIFFVSAEKPSALNELIGKLTRAQRVKADGGARAKPALNEGTRWLQRHQKWLLILDNVDDEASFRAVQKLLADINGSDGKVILTGRLRFPPTVESQELGLLSLVAAKGFLVERARRRRKRAEEIESADAAALASELGCLPLLLVQAADYIDQQQISFDEYLKRWRANKADVLHWFMHGTEFYDRDVDAATALQIAVQEMPSEAIALLERMAFFAPEPIPEDILQPADMSNLIVLAKYSLVSQKHEVDRVFTIHRLVQHVVRHRLQELKSAPARLSEAMALIRKGLQDPQFADIRHKVIPHAVSVLHFVHRDEYRDLDASDEFDALSQQVIHSLLRANRDDVSAEYLGTILSEFYEVAPLFGAVQQFQSQYARRWAEIEADLLKEANYVLKYVMAASLGEGAIRDPQSQAELEARFENAVELNEVEVAGYALALLYSVRPELINRSYLNRLAALDVYVGPAIIGYLFMNLALRQDVAFDLRQTVKSPNFWKSKWGLVRLDIAEISAAELFFSKPRRRPGPKDGPDIKECYASLIEANSTRAAFIKEERDERLVKLFRDYFELALRPQAIVRSSEALIASPLFKKQIKFLLGHPVWSVSEEAASVLASLEPDASAELISSLLSCENWRVRYGAIEAAFFMRARMPEIFYTAVSDFYASDNCRMRGLCAENLFAIMLATGADRRIELMDRFKAQISFWLLDEDCWVLEHVFRFFSTLFKRGIDCRWLLSQPTSPLLADMPNWFERDRVDFMRHIEQKKAKLEKGAGA